MRLKAKLVFVRNQCDVICERDNKQQVPLAHQRTSLFEYSNKDGGECVLEELISIFPVKQEHRYVDGCISLVQIEFRKVGIWLEIYEIDCSTVTW